jgi:ketosteroid isomerase-like protein
MMSTQENKAVLVRWLEALGSLDRDRWDQLVDELYTADYFFYDPSFANMRGRADLKQWMRRAMLDVASFQFKIEDLVAEGDCVAVRGVETVTLKSTGKTALYSTMLFNHMVDGMISEQWQLFGPVQP